MKRCSKCGLKKDNFSPDRTRKDGLAGHCRDCNNKASIQWKHKNKEYHNAQGKKWHQENNERSRANGVKWRLENPEKRKEGVARWDRSHKENRSHNEAKRRMRGKIKFGQEGIVEFYRNCPPGYQIDHVIPLKGKLVSGLHVVWNLQYLPAKENLKKSNRFIIR